MHKKLNPMLAKLTALEKNKTMIVAAAEKAHIDEMWTVLVREAIILEKVCQGVNRRFGMPPNVSDSEISQYKAKAVVPEKIDLSQEEALYARFLKFYERFTFGIVD